VKTKFTTFFIFTIVEVTNMIGVKKKVMKFVMSVAWLLMLIHTNTIVMHGTKSQS